MKDEPVEFLNVAEVEWEPFYGPGLWQRGHCRDVFLPASAHASRPVGVTGPLRHPSRFVTRSGGR
jgi:hypothetical protein